MSFEVYRNFDFSGGLRIRDTHAEINPNECALSQNMVSSGKALRVLAGYSKFNKRPIDGYRLKPVKSMFRFTKPADPTVKRFMASIGDTVFTANEPERTWTPLLAGLDESAQADFATSGDTSCYITTAHDGLYKYNGQGSPYLLADAPRGSTISTHYNRLFCGGDPNHPNRFYWSKPGQPDNWDTVNQYQELPAVNGDSVTKTIFFLDGSLVFKQNSIWHVTGNVEPFPVFSVSETLGTPSGKSVVMFEQSVIWYSNTGHICAYDGARIFNLTEQKLGKLPVARSMTDSVCCAVIDNQLWVSYCDKDSGETFNNRVLIADLGNGLADPRWFGPHKGFRISAFCSFSGQGDNGSVYFGDSATSTVWLKGDMYYMGASLCGTTSDAGDATISVVTAEPSIDVDELAGCCITLTGATGGSQKRVITANTAFLSDGQNYTGTITVNKQWDTQPDANTLWEIGRIDAKYHTGPLVLLDERCQKIFDKILLQTESQGDYSIEVQLIKDQQQSGNRYFYSMLGCGSLWDEAQWDTGEFANLDMIDRYIDLDFEFGKYLTIALSVTGRHRPALLYGFMLFYTYSDML
ncbi:MAG: hypothetical protein RBU23_12635 [Candidatus Auribacterota bacterium]|jgi:hypothetical protein|nr:hypothetical protein [Candidatus Auribacterota bacterium]